MAVRSYRDLEIYKLSYSLALEVDKMTKNLPRYEFDEEGRQIRRSSKSIPANIAEGYGRKRYRGEYVSERSGEAKRLFRFTVYALSSCDETTVHLDFLRDCGHIDDGSHQHLFSEYDKLGKMLNNFLKSIDAGRSR